MTILYRGCTSILPVKNGSVNNSGFLAGIPPSDYKLSDHNRLQFSQKIFGLENAPPIVRRSSAAQCDMSCVTR